jgi:hypothetical protein
MEILFSVEKFEGGAKFNNYSTMANMFVHTGEYVVLIPNGGFLIWDYDFEISTLKITFE